EHVRPSARAAKRAGRDRQVVAHEIELRMAGLRKEHFARIGDRHLAAGDRHTLVLGVGGHRADYTAVTAASNRALSAAYDAVGPRQRSSSTESNSGMSVRSVASVRKRGARSRSRPRLAAKRPAPP